MLITFSSLAPRCRIERLLDPTTLYSCLSNKPKQPCPTHPSKPCSAMLLLLTAQPLLSMHARMLSTVILLLFGLGVTPSELVTVIITTVIPLLVIITVDDQALITFDHSSLQFQP